MDYPYVLVSAKLKEFLSTKMRSVAVPINVNRIWLKTIGYNSSNDQQIINVLKFVNFIDSSNKPTELWRKYRGDYKAALAQGVQEGYKDLYAIYPDAHNRSTQELENFFKTHTSVGDRAVTSMVSTFKILGSHADFSRLALHTSTESDTPKYNSKQEDVNPESSTKVDINKSPIRNTASPSLHIDIQIHIDANAKAEQIDQIFASMAKHLYDKDKE